MNAEIIAVGSELLTPSRLESNSLLITAELNRIGVTVKRKSIVGDREEDLREALDLAMRGSDVIIFSGGLGPTSDDITREAVAARLGRRLSLNAEVLSALERRYAQLSMPMTENNRRQAMVPEGAEVMANPRGSAPGLFLEEDGVLIFLLPGPPRELSPMLVEEVIPRIRSRKPVSRLIFRQVRVAALAESRVDALVEPIYRRFTHVETTILSSPGVIDLFFYWRGPQDENLAAAELSRLVEQVQDRLGERIFSLSSEPLEEAVGRLLRSQGKTLATAESCTGGWLGKLLTDVPGSSEYFVGGVVSYHDRLKTAFLGVKESSLERYGAVSEPVALQMADGIRKHSGADIGVSITGIAGPGGEHEDKPIGLVFLGLSSEKGSRVERMRFAGEREAIRLRACRHALDLVRRTLQ